MATGIHFGGQCFADAFLATDALVSAHYPTKYSFENGCAYKISALTEADFEGDVKVRFIKSLIDDTQTESCPATMWYEYTSLSPCEIVTSADVAEASWMVAAVWLAVYGVRLLRRALP